VAEVDTSNSLTYMSTWNEVKSPTGQTLYRVPQSFPGLPEKRTIYCSAFVRNLATGVNADTEGKIRGRELRADFDYFIDGRKIYLRPLFSRDEPAHMALLEPPDIEVWEIRSIDPSPSLRVFGSFTRKDVFVALTWAARRDLGGQFSKEWRAAIQEFREEWEVYFGTIRPLAGSYDDVNHYEHIYLSNARVIY
jgi:hypothetical protein